MSRELKQFLFDHYGGFANKKIKRLERDAPFQIDDREETDHCGRFCHISLRVNDDDAFELTLENVPTGKRIEDLVATNGGRVETGRFGAVLSIQLTINDTDFILRLANEIRRLVRPRAKYSNPNWWWVCPRTAASLERLADALEEYQRHQQANKDEENLFDLLNTK